MSQAVARDMAGARAEAAVDWFLHPVLTGLGGAELAEVAALAADGHTSIKVFLSNPGFAAGTPRPGGPGRSPSCTARTRTCWNRPAAS
jgi:hypothetical protein